MSLEDDLTDIRGIGDSKANQIMALVEAECDGVDRELVERAYDKLQAGRDGLALDALESALEE